MGISQLTGTPWHKERVHRSEGDERRYKGRCAFYNYEKVTCKKAGTSCHGSAHCDYYKAISDEEFKKRQKSSQKNNQKKVKKKSFEDDCYWY